MLTRRHLAFWLRVAFLVGATGAVDILCRTGVIPNFTMIPPSQMAAHLGAGLWAGTYTADIAFTFANIGAAIAISILLGAGLGLVIHARPRLRRLLDPMLASYYSVPTFVFYPLLIVLLGLT